MFLRSTGVVWQRLLSAAGGAGAAPAPQQRGYQNYVMSDALSQLEQYCEKLECCEPRKSDRKVTVIGAASDVGRMACLFLKQQQVIRNLAMYDEIPMRRVLGVAHDLSHIDTSTAIQAYQGRPFLRTALDNADVVLICGGYYTYPPCCNAMDRELFYANMQYVRTTCLNIAHFSPYALICIQTPPVDCNFALCKYTLMRSGVYSKRRLLGVNAVNSMRANKLYCELSGADPGAEYAPVVCGTGRCTRVPVFSNLKQYVCIPPEKIDCITRLVREADELVCRVKCNREQGYLSIGFSTARFVTNCMKGLFEKNAFIDSALVEQDDPEKCYGMPICASPVVIGDGGIVEYRIPQLNDKESSLLEESKCDLEDMLNLGRCNALGEEYTLHPCKVCPLYIPPPPCKVCSVCKAS